MWETETKWEKVLWSNETTVKFANILNYILRLGKTSHKHTISTIKGWMQPHTKGVAGAERLLKPKTTCRSFISQQDKSNTKTKLCMNDVNTTIFMSWIVWVKVQTSNHVRTWRLRFTDSPHATWKTTGPSTKNSTTAVLIHLMRVISDFKFHWYLI